VLAGAAICVASAWVAGIPRMGESIDARGTDYGRERYMPQESPDLAAWTRAVLATFWQAEHPLTRDELAASLGASAETIDAALKAVSARGLIASRLVEP
jgi:hypothetical protein